MTHLTSDVLIVGAGGAGMYAAVAAARAVFDDPSHAWNTMMPSERGRLIWKIGDLILENADELAELESLDNGKPKTVAAAADVPEILLEQLAPGGIMIVPAGLDENDQHLLRVKRTEEGAETQDLGPTRFVPLIDGMVED